MKSWMAAPAGGRHQRHAAGAGRQRTLALRSEKTSGSQRLLALLKGLGQQALPPGLHQLYDQLVPAARPVDTDLSG